MNLRIILFAKAKPNIFVIYNFIHNDTIGIGIQTHQMDTKEPENIFQWR